MVEPDRCSKTDRMTDKQTDRSLDKDRKVVEGSVEAYGQSECNEIINLNFLKIGGLGLKSGFPYLGINGLKIRKLL